MARGEITGKKRTQTADRTKWRHGPPTADSSEVEPTTKAEPGEPVSADATPIRAPPSADATPSKEQSKVTDKKERTPGEWRKPPAQAAAFSIGEFCRAHRLSPSMFFKLKAEGLGPREMQVGRRTLISVEAAAEWRRAREAEAAATVA
jgi:hypothetical protein